MVVLVHQQQEVVHVHLHYLVVVVGDVFEGLPTIKRQQMINKALFQYVMDGTIHALHPRAFTPSEWAERQA